MKPSKKKKKILRHGPRLRIRKASGALSEISVCHMPSLKPILGMGKAHFPFNSKDMHWGPVGVVEQLHVEPVINPAVARC